MERCKGFVIKMINTRNNDLLDLIENIFVYEPNKRITPEDAMRHPYFSDLK